MKEKKIGESYKNLIDITLGRDIAKQPAQATRFADFYLGDALAAWKTKKLLTDLNNRGTDVALLQRAGKVESAEST